MSIEMRGADVAKAMKEELIREVDSLKAEGIQPCLAIVRAGARPDDLAYERGARKRMELVGISLLEWALLGSDSQRMVFVWKPSI